MSLLGVRRVRLDVSIPSRTVAAGIAVIALAAGCASQPSKSSRYDGGAGPVGRVVAAKESSGHRLRVVPAQQAPQVRRFRVTQDRMGGWNIHLLTQRFRFAPAHASEKARGGEGHAHLYIDGEKYTRLYGPWFYLPDDVLSPGAHTLKVTLNANDHTAWAVDGEPVQAATRVTARANSGGGITMPARTAMTLHRLPHLPRRPGGRGGQTPHQRRNGHPGIAPCRDRAGNAGSPDRHQRQPNTVHVHGYGKETTLRPAAPAILEFVAHRTGVFDVETHDPELQLVQLEVQ